MASARRTSRRSSTAPERGEARHLHLDCPTGAAGNMLVGALLDLGTPRRVVRDAISALDIGAVRMRVERARRGALDAAYVRFGGPERSPPERRWRSIRRLLGHAPLGARVRERALAVFGRLARAEGRVHGIDPDRVHFHEVGAVDALCDVVGVCAAVEHLGVSSISASALPLGHGSVETQHGRLPLPAPATLELLVGLPTYPLDVPWETVTPTGAALIAELAGDFGPMPALRPLATGYGAGNDRPGPLPNALRAVLGSRGVAVSTDTVSVIEANLDDSPPEHLPYLLERLMEEGALDASLCALLMKKGRPGQLLRVLCRPADRDRLARLVLLESSTLGVRFRDEARQVLPRQVVRVATPWGRVEVKLARDPEGRVTAAAEHDACARVARRAGIPLAQVYREAERLALEQAS